ncbi:MAG TPA: class I SAM-dependent methyltransferase [Pyrinomonadaceae bacterium]|nr:class I SAM-dependent methyltransferase [Pyrinomonadaceae bacterium]
MPIFRLSPLASFVEHRLFDTARPYAAFHRLTGRLVEPDPSVFALLQAARLGNPLSFTSEQLRQLGEPGRQIQRLIDFELVIQDGHDPLSSFVDFYVNRPLQNPALSYKNEAGQVSIVSMSMTERVYSPERGNLPQISEEIFSDLATSILLAADGTKTLRQIHAGLRPESDSVLDDGEFREAVEFLTTQERQLIKFASGIEDFGNPFAPANIVPRNLYHASRWTGHEGAKSIQDFHLEGIDDATWEFDVIEPTVNHMLRFPSQLLSGLDYGTRFCDAVFEYAPALATAKGLDVLEIGGGTGTFARAFIQQARATVGSLSYQIMDLSPVLAESQRRVLTDIQPAVNHVVQDATELDLPGHTFDLIMANEVIADFPVASVERVTEDAGRKFAGEGAACLEEYGLSTEDAPSRFYVNSGVFRFLERAWNHLNPGGEVIVSEYGGESLYPRESFHLNHSEFSIHFGHVIECARKIGFNCRLAKLTEYLGIDDRTPVLGGPQEHLICLNYVFEKYAKSLPFALFSAVDFNARFGELASGLRLAPIRFLPLRNNFHYGPNLGDFFVLMLGKRPSKSG